MKHLRNRADSDKDWKRFALIFLITTTVFEVSEGYPFEGAIYGDESGGGEFMNSELANSVPRLGRRSPMPRQSSFRFSRGDGYFSPYRSGRNQIENIYDSGFRFREEGGSSNGLLSKREDVSSSSRLIQRFPDILSGKFDASAATRNVVQDYYWTKLLDDVAKNAINAKIAKLSSMAKEVEKESSSKTTLHKRVADSPRIEQKKSSWSRYQTR